MMSSECGLDFASHIDACGGVMWIWHQKTTAENHGLEIIKPATKVLAESDLPSNWKDHIDVISRKRSKVRINELQEKSQDTFEALTSSRQITPLDAVHKVHIDELQRSGFTTMWISDHHLLQTHTKALERLTESMTIKGIFRTNSEGRNPGTANCFLFPVPNGAWRVYRFSPGITEAETWDQDGNGWTNCYFNREPDLHLAAKSVGGLEAPDNGGYVFPSSVEAVAAIEALGQTLTIPDELKDRQARIRSQRDGRLAIEFDKTSKKETVAGWISEKGRLRKLLTIKAEMKAQAVEEMYAEHDKFVAQAQHADEPHCRLEDQDRGRGLGRRSEGRRQKFDVMHGKSDAQAKIVLGECVNNPWKLVNQPFQPEYIGDRMWNLDASQYSCKPVEGDHPHWDSVMRHCFGDLDGPIKEHPWCRKVGVKTGCSTASSGRPISYATPSLRCLISSSTAMRTRASPCSTRPSAY